LVDCRSEWINYFVDGVVVGDGITLIEENAFYDCSSLKSVTISNTVESIGNYAFGGCSGLTEVVIPDSVESIGDAAFGGCSNLTSVTLGDKVNSSLKQPFLACPLLSSITVKEGNKYLSVVDDVLFDINGSTLLVYAAGKTDVSYTIPDGVVSISNYAFSASVRLNTVIIPDTVEIIGEYVFYKCDGLESITIPASVTSIGEGAFYDCGNLSSVFYLGSVSDSMQCTDAFLNCPGVENVCVPPDYDSGAFCSKNASPSDNCQPFQSMFNHCYEAVYINGNFVQQKRKNATEWENKTTGCVEYRCDDVNGGITLDICNSSDGISRKCVDDECIILEPSSSSSSSEPSSSWKPDSSSSKSQLVTSSSSSSSEKDGGVSVGLIIGIVAAVVVVAVAASIIGCFIWARTHRFKPIEAEVDIGDGYGGKVSQPVQVDMYAY